MAASLGPGSGGAQADVTPWFFLPCLTTAVCVSVSFVLVVGGTASWEVVFPLGSTGSITEDGVTWYLGHF